MDQRKKKNVKTQNYESFPPIRDPELISIQDLVSSFEQIADMPQNRGCLSWDGAEERGERCRESLEERGTWRGTGDEFLGNCTIRQK